MSDIHSVDPRTGAVVETVTRETTPEELDAVCRAAADAAPRLEALGRRGRAELLRALAEALEEDRADIVAVADRETALGRQRLDGELTRTRYQFELFAQALEEGSYLEATIDHAGDTPMGPRPDVRRMLLPIGPVAVFGAGNFPLAFSVPGGDTVAALAAGCPVVVKAHPSHPATSRRCFEVMRRAIRDTDTPEAAVALVYGQRAGTDAVAHPAIRAVSFTGSPSGGRALFDIASSRPDPIPFYGELGSSNPLVVTPGAAASRAEEITSGIVGSFTLGGGQFCTKPGLVFVPDDTAGTRIRKAMADAVTERGPEPSLNEEVWRGYLDRSRRLAAAPAVELVAEGRPPESEGWEVPVRLLATRAEHLDEAVTTECFGPSTLLVSYRDSAELVRALEAVPGSLTASLQAVDGETELVRRVEAAVRAKTGRLVYNGYPTGVAVTWAMHHGGPWPATTNALHTSVGVTSIRRFLRPMAWQNVPQELLPDELRDTPATAVPRRVDGVLHP